MNDNATTISELKQCMADFVKERNWEKYHTPKNLSMSISIEAAELMEIFQWIENEQVLDLCKDPEKFTHIKEEIADVVSYCLSIANTLNIDISHELEQKMVKNRAKYPKEKFYGNYHNES